MSRKKRSKGEVEEIVRAFAQGSSIPEISSKFEISESAFYRILKVSRGLPPDSSARKTQAKVERLEKELSERNREIALMRSILKKS